MHTLERLREMSAARTGERSVWGGRADALLAQKSVSIFEPQTRNP
jgi:hypothetical protein